MSASEELRTADAVAAGLNRGLNVEPMRWSELLAIAQRELNEFQRRTHVPRASELYDEEAASRLIAAARIVQEVATRSSAEGEAEELAELLGETPDDYERGIADKEERHLLLVLASCAYGMYGNFPSAAAVQRLIDFRLVRSEAQWLTLAVSNPRNLSSALRSRFVGDAGREFLERFNMFLVNGNEAEAEQLISHFEEFLRMRVPLAEITFLRGARLALKHCINLATARLNRLELGDVFHGFLDQIIAEGRPCLLPPQHNVISDGFLTSSANAVVTIPTSTGKTLLGELAVAARMRRDGDVSIYVTPYIALGRQVFDCFMEHKAENVDVRGYFGNFNSHIEAINTRLSTIIVATPERIDAILRSNDLYPRLRTVVFDEAHGVENGVRGARLEALIARMRLQQRSGRDIRLILLSAVLSNVEQLREWLGAEAEHYEDSWRPTARRLAIWTNDGRLGWLYGADPLRPASKHAGSFLGRKTLEWPQEMWPASTFGGMAYQKASAYENVSFLARYVRSSIGGPVMIACYAKQTTRGVAAAIAEQLPDQDEPRAELGNLLNALAAHPHLNSLEKMVRKGVAYHNASLPSKIKRLIEDAIKVRALDFVSATTTLAEGVDLPFRATIIFDWLLGFGDDQSPMSALLFRNIAGRCGRAGEFTEGDTVIFDNVLGNPAFVSERARRQSQAKLFGDPPPLRSVVANENLPDETKGSIRAVMSSQLMAAIPENPTDEAVERSLSLALYAAFHDEPPTDLFSELRTELLNDGQGEPFARAASPMWLTPLGQAANRTGFGPKTCRQMLNFLGIVREGLEPSAVAAEVLQLFGACEEQNNHLLREVVAGRRSSRFFVRASDLQTLATGWLNSTSLTELFVALPKAESSKAAVPPQRWASGEAENEFVAAQYDKFVDLMEYAFGGFLPWLFRALAALSELAPRATSYPWAEFAREFESSRAADEEAIDLIFAQGSSE